MNDSLRKKIVFATLPLALVWAAFNLSGRKTAPVDPVPAESYYPDSTATVVHQNPLAVDLDYQKDAAWGRDPFSSMTGSPATTSRTPSENLAWVLAGIVYGGRQPMALINNRMVTVGDRVGDATVVAIEKESVTLEQRGQRFKLRVSKG